MSRFVNELSVMFADFDLATVVALLIKFTVLVAMVLLFYRLTARRPASFRHAVLVAGVLFTPVLLVCHFLTPAWSVPTPGFLTSEFLVNNEQVAESNAQGATGDFFVPGANGTDDLNGAWSNGSDQDSGTNNGNTNGFICPTNDDGGEIGDCHDESSGTLIGCPSTIEQTNKAFAPAFAGSVRSYSGVLSLICLIWIAIAGLLLARLTLAWVFMAKRVHYAIPVSAKKLRKAGLSDELIADFLTNNIRIKIHRSRNQMPLGTGLFQKTILLPRDCKSWTTLEWQAVLLHEKAHFDRGDCWINLAARIQQALLWFHPLSSLVLRMLRNESEFACDDRVIESGLSRVAYAEVLLQMASKGRYRSSANLVSVTMSDSAPLESRMNLILNDTRPRRAIGTRTLVAFIATFSLLLVPVATAQFLNHSQPADASTAETDSARLDSANPNAIADAVPAQEIAEEEVVFNVLLRPGKGDTTYGGEFVASCDDILRIQTASDEVKEIEFADIAEIYRDPFVGSADYGGTIVKLINGETIQPLINRETPTPIENETLGFQLTQSDESEGQVKTVKPQDIYLVKRVIAASLKPGQITHGVASSKLTYHLRAPETHDDSDQWPALVLLHRNGATSTEYIEKVAETWPAIANRYVLIGLDGERPSRPYKSHVANPGFNYTGLSFVGDGANFRGYDGTERESPAPIAEAIAELRQRFGFSQLFLAGHGHANHTSGGNNAYHIHTYFPDVTDGIVVMAGEVLVQCDITEFTDPEIMRQQRETPIVIVEPEIESSTSGGADWAYNTYLDNSFPMLKYLKDGAGSSFTELPLDQAIDWLEKISVKDPEEALKLAEHFVSDKNYRDANALAHRFTRSGQRDETTGEAADTAIAEIVNRAFLENKIQFGHFSGLLGGSSDSTLEGAGANGESSSIDEFLKLRETWEFAPLARDSMTAFNDLRNSQNPDAKSLFVEARKMDRNGEQNVEVDSLYTRLNKQFPASAFYRRAKAILDSR